MPIRPRSWLATLLTLAVGWAGSAAAALAAETFRVVVHPSNPVESLDGDEVADFFLRRKTAWADGVAVEPVDQVADRPVREAFSFAVHHRAGAAIKSFWQRQIFSGGAVPPAELQSDAEVVAMVLERRGAIGYVTARAALGGAKAVDVVCAPRPTSRTEPEYPNAARRARVEGRVLLDVRLGTDGKILGVDVVKGLAMGLTDAAIEAVRGWTFDPATRNGDPIAATTTITVHFEL